MYVRIKRASIIDNMDSSIFAGGSTNSSDQTDVRASVEFWEQSVSYTVFAVVALLFKFIIFSC